MLTSLQNPLVKEVRRLHQSKYRRQQQRFLLEGTHLVQEALGVAYPLDTVFYTPLWQQRYGDLASGLQLHVKEVYLVSPAVLAALATTIYPDGVVAVAPQISPPRPASLTRVGVLLEALQDPGNLGTIIRSAVAAGADGLWLTADSVAPDHPKVLRASAGQWFHLPLTVVTDLSGMLADWQKQSVQLVATDARADLSYWQVDLTLPTVFFLGNEGAGLSSLCLDRADVRVRIPMQGQVESLNVAVAAALLLYEAARQRQQQG
jgi:TrmH family RNA methyltransferase